MTELRRINLAFIGSGSWARRYHFPALAHLIASPPPALQNTDLRLRGIYSLEPETARGVAACYGFGRVYSSLDALIADDTVDAIAVAVTPSALLSVVERVIVKGVPLFSEKPPGVSIAEAQRLSELVTVPNVLAFNRRYVPLYHTFKVLVDETPGIYFVEGHFFRHERHDGTFMIGTGIHWINFMEYLFGTIRQAEVDRFPTPDNATWNRVARLTFDGGLKGVLKVFPCSGTQAERIEAHSSARSLYLDGPLWEQPGRITIDAGSTQEIVEPETKTPLPEIVRLGIVGEYVEFLTQACRDRPTRSNFQNAVNSMRVAEAME